MILGQEITHSPSHALAAKLIKEINGGRLKPGEKLAGLRETAQRHKVSLATVRHSFKLLARDGFLISQHGSGTFVNPALKTRDTKMIALLTMVKEKSFDNYFEPLFSEAVNSNIVPIVGILDPVGNWKDSIRKITAREPDALLIDVEGRRFEPDELRKVCAPFPCCFVNRWEWHKVKPERAVLNDYPAAYRKVFSYLKGKGHRRVLIVGHNNPMEQFLKEYLKEAINSVDMEFGKEFAYTGIFDIEKKPKLLKEILKKNSTTAVFGLSDYVVHQFLQYALKASVDTSNLEKIGLFDQSYSNIPGNEFTSIRFDLGKIWKRAFDYCNAGDKSFVEYVEPELIVRESGRVTKCPSSQVSVTSLCS